VRIFVAGASGSLNPQFSDTGAAICAQIHLGPGRRRCSGRGRHDDRGRGRALNRMGEAGYLVAAGPMIDAVGEGMTILRLPGTAQLARATVLATEDDVSVAQGFSR
jgi:hypothetical protein